MNISFHKGSQIPLRDCLPQTPANSNMPHKEWVFSIKTHPHPVTVDQASLPPSPWSSAEKAQVELQVGFTCTIKWNIHTMSDFFRSHVPCNVSYAHCIHSYVCDEQQDTFGPCSQTKCIGLCDTSRNNVYLLHVSCSTSSSGTFATAVD